MAKKKTTKKKTKTQKSEQTKQVVEAPKQKLVEEGNYSMVFSDTEMVSLIQILTLAQAGFEQMAIEFHGRGDDRSTKMWAARSQLSGLLAEKVKTAATIGEPISKELH